MISKVYTCALMGINGLIIEVETDISNGLPGFTIVGLPDAAVKESKERVRSSIRNSGYNYPVKKITVNLAPADVRKIGPCYDLPIAIGILASTGQVLMSDISDYVFLGELSLDGRVKPVNGVLCMAAEAERKGYKKIIVPFKNANEAAIVKGIEIYPVSTLKEAIEILNNPTGCLPYEPEKNIYNSQLRFYDDFLDIKGQESAKRALEIAAAGGHNIVMIGPPGSGKTMLAQRLPGILPDMSREEAIEITKIYSITGYLDPENGIVDNRPFRSPHHTITSISLVGGGKVPRPGEVSLAHNGVLFLDELPEFHRDALEVLRQPIEDGRVNVSRVNGSLTFPSSFMLIASMNPCPCGFFNDPVRECTCNPVSIRKYLGKISGPLLDRIDIHIEVYPVKYDDLETEAAGESSDIIRKRVNEARKRQLKRYKDYNIYCNAQLSAAMIKKYCKINDESKKMMKSVFERLGLSARAYNKILKVARTIADIEGEENINTSHIAEAIQYRSMDRKYWESGM
ncbi:competence protein ComM [Oxobacter pfennigii]|uniref:Competence protein ComM n=1 Tax=Oxobacter pfennigii TaxID=36849 RepID=A0A0P8W5I5_9CLOT|nr:YifB family Mg chelatase-like AAA ATPase [Oxobacter pfennigii]KPU43924.1 competence protein ComM [Oxobacter pfennigii]